MPRAGVIRRTPAEVPVGPCRGNDPVRAHALVDRAGALWWAPCCLVNRRRAGIMLGWLAHPVANVDRRWRRLLAALLATVCAVAVAPSFVVAAPPTTTLTFDELSTRPVNGVQVAGVSFDFRVGGAASSDATYGAFGPGSTTYVQDPSLEGTTAGALTLRFSHPTT